MRAYPTANRWVELVGHGRKEAIIGNEENHAEDHQAPELRSRCAGGLVPVISTSTGQFWFLLAEP
jgi:hypothetical protein